MTGAQSVINVNSLNYLICLWRLLQSLTIQFALSMVLGNMECEILWFMAIMALHPSFMYKSEFARLSWICTFCYCHFLQHPVNDIKWKILFWFGFLVNLLWYRWFCLHKCFAESKSIVPNKSQLFFVIIVFYCELIIVFFIKRICTELSQNRSCCEAK